ncbi:cilia- and flagella-associated protein 206 [Scleropages formosus]|nr:cilia- and flagella-associated protein 206 [Scleropages formosus]XP_018599040.1 cilia- and flagella-associated protein 206 [Scleropages formosus]XP_029105667.1 cilia- and flagella-associated protein 206 [Scleropages formosus]
MSRAQAEGVIKKIIREIVQECVRRSHSVSDTLVAFMIKAVVLDPINQFNVDRPLTKQDVRRLTQLCVDRLVDQRSPSVDTIKMQVYFDMNYTSQRELREEHEHLLLAKLSPVVCEITETRAKTHQALDGLYRKIVSYILLRSGMGSPTNLSTVRETTAALRSVFPQSELGTFMSLMKRDKEQQLVELTRIVTGIRLFNKNTGKGGEDVDDLPEILNEALPICSMYIESELGTSRNLAYQYTAILENFQRAGAGARGYIFPPDLLKQALYNVRQHEAFLNIILADVILCAKRVETLQADLHSEMEELKATVQSRAAVPTAQVFPRFTALAKLWSGFQDEMIFLSVLNNMVTSLKSFLASQSQLLPEDQVSILLEGMEVKSDEQRLKESAENHMDPSEFENQEWLFPETTANFDKLPFEYKGMCAYTLVKDGSLLPGNPSIGILKHRNKFYIFSSKEAACDFAANPDENIEQLAEIVRRSPELIQLLDLHHQFVCITPYSETESEERLLVKPITMCDSCTQTDTHPVESNIVKSYEWNEWELRRKAIKLANLRRKVTHSMQTNLSHMRRDNVSQVYLPRDTACQTKKEGTSNVPQPQVYLAGLRGGETKTTHFIKTNLTRPADE